MCIDRQYETEMREEMKRTTQQIVLLPLVGPLSDRCAARCLPDGPESERSVAVSLSPAARRPMRSVFVYAHKLLPELGIVRFFVPLQLCVRTTTCSPADDILHRST